MVVLKGFIVVPDEDIIFVKQALVEHILLTQQEEGCLHFEVTPDEKNPNRFNVYEEFRSKADLELHHKRVSTSNWGNVTKNVSRHYEVEETQ